MPTIWRWLVVGSGLAAFACGQESGFRIARVFGSHMVLPAARQVPLHGFGPPGAQVVVQPSWAAAVETSVTRDGRWQVAIDTGTRGGVGAIALRCGERIVRLDDLVFGDVWLASGQSNMEWTLGQIGAEGVIAAADHPDLRVFTVGRRTADVPGGDVDGTWARCTPEVAEQLSAVGYFFASDLVARGHGPIGLVVSAWGGTVCEAWTSRTGLAGFPEFHAALEQQHNGERERRLRTARERFFAAAARAGRKATATEVQVPERWSHGDLNDFDGVVDYTRELTLPPAFRGRELRLELGPIDDMDVVLWNGERLAGSERDGMWNVPRRYQVPAVRTSAAQVELGVRVIDTGGEGGFTGEAAALRLVVADDPQQVLPLAGTWQRWRRASLAELPKWPRAASGPNRPAVLWNGMIEPLLPFPFAGVIWYQGESNRLRPEQYARLFPAMIRDWRRAFAAELPFLFVQIAPFRYARDPADDIAALRLAQAAATSLPRTGMVVTLDVGDPANIHPLQKQPVGERLARWARRMVYGEDCVVEGPRARFAQRRGARVRVSFATGQEPELLAGGAGFELRSAGGAFRPATAQIVDGALWLHAAGVEVPVEVRYAWGAVPAWSLRHRDGLPGAPFRLPVE